MNQPTEKTASPNASALRCKNPNKPSRFTRNTSDATTDSEIAHDFFNLYLKTTN